MDIAIGLLLAQGALGAFDTLWYHEWMLRRWEGTAKTARKCLPDNELRHEADLGNRLG
jgi:hypothetical protein